MRLKKIIAFAMVAYCIGIGNGFGTTHEGGATASGGSGDDLTGGGGGVARYAPPPVAERQEFELLEVMLWGGSGETGHAGLRIGGQKGRYAALWAGREITAGTSLSTTSTAQLIEDFSVEKDLQGKVEPRAVYTIPISDAECDRVHDFLDSIIVGSRTVKFRGIATSPSRQRIKPFYNVLFSRRRITY
jgi:hypothetical protein